jgi:hypothetical protein
VPLGAKTLGHAERLYVVSAERKSKKFIGDASSDVSNKRGTLAPSITGEMAKITLAEIDLSGLELRPSATWRALSLVRMRVVSDSRIPVDVDRSALICTWCVT